MNSIDNIYAEQTQLLNTIKQKLSSETLAKALMKVLHISKDSAYRRINNETPLSYKEALTLANRYNVDLQPQISYSNHPVNFERRNPVKNIDDVCNNLSVMQASIEQQLSIPDGHIIYSTKDIPIFYHFAFPALGAFKVFSWLNAVSDSTHRTDKFDPESIYKRFGTLWKKLVDGFIQIPGIELWSEFAVFNFIRQVEYYYSAQLFKDKQSALTVCEEYRTLFNSIEQQAIWGCKVHPSKPNTKTTIPYELYFNETLVMENAVLAFQGDRKVFFQSYAYFNFAPTTDQVFCNDMEIWLNRQLKKSVKLSESRIKERNQYFDKIDREILALMDRITRS